MNGSNPEVDHNGHDVCQEAHRTKDIAWNIEPMIGMRDDDVAHAGTLKVCQHVRIVMRIILPDHDEGI